MAPLSPPPNELSKMIRNASINEATSNAFSGPSNEDFGGMVDQFFQDCTQLQGTTVNATAVCVDRKKNLITVDLGLKSEGYVPLNSVETALGRPCEVGDTFPVFVERYENKNGDTVLSFERAQREMAWRDLQVKIESQQPIEIMITDAVKGGFRGSYGGISVFLPLSHSDSGTFADAERTKSALVGHKHTVCIIKIDPEQKNVVVSKKLVNAEVNNEKRKRLIGELQVGQIVAGIVKKKMDYGVFVVLDLEGADGTVEGLVHITDVAWGTVRAQSENTTAEGTPSVLPAVGSKVQVKILRINPENNRISLGMKQLTDDPWLTVEKRFAVGSGHDATVSYVTSYGLFVTLEPGIEGFVSVGGGSLSRYSIGMPITVRVVGIDQAKRRLRVEFDGQARGQKISEKLRLGDTVEGVVRDVTSAGVSVTLEDDIDAFLHIDDMSWEGANEALLANYAPGLPVKAMIVDVNDARRKVTLSAKHLMADPLAEVAEKLRVGDIVSCVITSIFDYGVEVSICDQKVRGIFIPKSELNIGANEYVRTVFKVGDVIDAEILDLDVRPLHRKIHLSYKALMARAHKEAQAKFGSHSASASIFGDR